MDTDLKFNNNLRLQRWESHWKLFRLAQASAVASDEAPALACSEIVAVMTELGVMSASRRRHAPISASSIRASEADLQATLNENLLSKLRAFCCLLCVSRQNNANISAASLCNMLSYLSDKKLNFSPVSSHSLELLMFACRSMVSNQPAVRDEVLPVLLALLSHNGVDRMRLLLGLNHLYDINPCSSVKRITCIVPDIALLRSMQFISEQMPEVRFRTISSLAEAMLRRYVQLTDFKTKQNSSSLSTALRSVIEMFLSFYIQHASIYTSCSGEPGVYRYGSSQSSQPKRSKLFGDVTIDVQQYTVLCAFPSSGADTMISKGYDAHGISQVFHTNIFSRFRLFLKALSAGGQHHDRLYSIQPTFAVREAEIKSFFEASTNEETFTLLKQLHASFGSRISDSSSLISCMVKYCDSLLTLCRTMANSFVPMYKRDNSLHHHDAERDALCTVAIHALDCLRLILVNTDKFADDIRVQASAALDTFVDRLCFTQEGGDALKFVLHSSLPTMLNVVVSVAGHCASSSESTQDKKTCADHAYIYRRIQTIFQAYLAVPDYLVVTLQRWALFDACCKCVAERNFAIAYQPHMAVMIDHLPALFFALVCNAKLHLFTMLRLIPAFVATFPVSSFEILFDLILNMPLLAQAVDIYLLISDEALSAVSGSGDGVAFATPALLAFRDPASSDTYAFMKNITPALRRFAYAVVALKTTEDFNCTWPSLMESLQDENELLKLEYRPRVADAVDVMPTLLSKLLEVVQQEYGATNLNKNLSAVVSQAKLLQPSSDEIVTLALSKILDNAQLHPILSRTPHIRLGITQLLSDAVSNIISTNASLLIATQHGSVRQESAEQTDESKQKYAQTITEHIGCFFLLQSPPIFTALVRSFGTTLVQQLSTTASTQNQICSRDSVPQTDVEICHRRFYEALESATYEIVRQNGELKYKQHLLNDETVYEAVVALLQALAAVGFATRYCAPTFSHSETTLEVQPLVIVNVDNVDHFTSSGVDSDYARRTVICFNNIMQRMQAMPADDNYRATVIRAIESLVEEYNMPSLNDVVQKLARSNELQVEPEVIEALQRQMTPSHSGEFVNSRRHTSEAV